MRIDLYRCSVVLVFTWFLYVIPTPLNAQEPTVVLPAPIPDAAQSTAESQVFLPIDARIDGSTLDRLHAALLRTDLKIMGATSCATSNCHAGPRPAVFDATARRGMEYQAWIENDPHAQSWRTICGDESVAMMRRLGILVGNRIVDRKGFDNCLACHNSTRRFDESRYTATSDEPLNQHLREGVGCSACHGPSEKWVNTHFQANWSPSSTTAEGFVEASDLYVRARMCASCHVGDKDRDMNHDIIAAGHPALRYELATFHAWQPKHWRDVEASDKTAYEAQLWLAGQIASADAALALLETRAKDAHTVSEWPEFAAYNCASCHHNLGLDNDRQAITSSRRATAIYSQWNDAGLRWLIDYRVRHGEAIADDHELLEALESVRVAMETRPRPNATEVAAAAVTARKAIARWYDGQPGLEERTQFRSDRLGRVIADAAGRPNTFQSWESAVQFYLAAIASRESWPGGWSGPMREVADQMQYGLQYPQMIDISRFAKRARARGPQSNRLQIRAMGIELASVLGPVEVEPAVTSESDDPIEIRRRLKRIFDNVRADLDKTRGKVDSDRTQTDSGKPDTIETTPPKKTPEELAEEILKNRERSENQDSRDDN